MKAQDARGVGADAASAEGRRHGSGNGRGPARHKGSSRQIYVMIGPPAAGKGTQAQVLSAALGIPTISSGDLFREKAREDTPLGRRVGAILKRGALVPDELTIRMIAERLRQPDAKHGAILDGFPRTRPQAEALDRLLASTGDRVSGALYIAVDPEEVVRRISGRRVCTGPSHHVYHLITNPPRVPGVCDIDGSPLEQRPDDRPETIRARLEQQLPPMYEVIDHYADQGVLFAVRGDQPIDAVTDELLRVVTATATPR